MAKQKITVTMVRSKIATTPKQRESLNGLGLTHRGRTRVLDDTASIRGMIKKVIHLVDVKKGDVTDKSDKKVFFTVKEPKEKATKAAAK
ncbi:MAG: 50S ribosomal protein L30 [Deltaproteobacteria bacterium]|nr:50S ribosomal protein L30 [Deltaproteobacteria bacterium]